MGKLHTLRRAIERNPKAWSWAGSYSYGAQVKNGRWGPADGPWYRGFVSHVLKQLREVGNADNGSKHDR